MSTETRRGNKELNMHVHKLSGLFNVCNLFNLGSIYCTWFYKLKPRIYKPRKYTKCLVKILQSPLEPQLINLLLSTGVFPEPLKIAKVIPLFKPANDPELLSDHRPISILPAFSKLFERVTCNRLMNVWTCIVFYIGNNSESEITIRPHWLLPI